MFSCRACITLLYKHWIEQILSFFLHISCQIESKYYFLSDMVDRTEFASTRVHARVWSRQWSQWDECWEPYCGCLIAVCLSMLWSDTLSLSISAIIDHLHTLVFFLDLLVLRVRIRKGFALKVVRMNHVKHAHIQYRHTHTRTHK